jgi:hypothetical protein
MFNRRVLQVQRMQAATSVGSVHRLMTATSVLFANPANI